MGSPVSKCLTKLSGCVVLLRNNRSEGYRVFAAEAFGEGRKDQNFPDAPDLDHSLWTGGLVPESSSLSGSAVVVHCWAL